MEGNHDAVWGQHNRERTVTVDDRICSLGQGENVVWLDRKRGGGLGGGRICGKKRLSGFDGSSQLAAGARGLISKLW